MHREVIFYYIIILLINILSHLQKVAVHFGLFLVENGASHTLEKRCCTTAVQLCFGVLYVQDAQLDSCHTIYELASV